MTERPVECSHCKKPIAITYKEIVDGVVTCTHMCQGCPVLAQRLHNQESPIKKEEAGLCCGKCGTTLETIQTGNPLGCVECYEVFSQIILKELSLPRSLHNKSQPLHMGKSPSKSAAIPPSDRLLALNEALNDALSQENYEQAAWLRDQIKALIEKENA